MIHNSDCIKALRKLEADSVDSLVTDPPAGISFMGKSWDDDKGGRDHWVKWLSEVMTECLRVLKPGGHALVWSIPRTSHWTTTAIENAGFEIRDVVTHLFGTGFPKSLDISKAIDKMHGAEREVIGSRIKAGDIKGSNNFASGRNEIGVKTEIKYTSPSTSDAIQWQGFGTALKPAAEFWILARKPLSEKTVAKNVLKWGTGVLNIDVSRIGTIENLNGGTYSKNAKPQGKTQVPRNGIDREFIQPTGRFPANLVFSCSPFCDDEQHDIECAIKMLDEQSGQSHYPAHDYKVKNGGGWKNTSKIKNQMSYGDTGGASRFFYCAKVSSSERNNAGDNNHPTVKPIKLMSYLIKLITPPNGTVLDPFMGSGSTGVACKKLGFKFIGIEKEKEYFDIAEKRIEAAV